MGLSDRHAAYRVLRAVLHALRDRLTVAETVDLGAQLPMLIRGLYYEGWTPNDKPLRERTREKFRHSSAISTAARDGPGWHATQRLEESCLTSNRPPIVVEIDEECPKNC